MFGGYSFDSIRILMGLPREKIFARAFFTAKAFARVCKPTKRADPGRDLVKGKGILT